MDHPVVTHIQSMKKRYEIDAKKIREAVDKLRTMAKEECRVNKHKYDDRDVKNLDHGDMSMISYLESCNWDVKEAVQSMSRHSVWRKENKYFDLKATDIPREMHESSMFHPFGVDKFGHPLFVFRASRYGIPKELHSISLKYFIWAAEVMRGKVINSDHKLALIFDCRQTQMNLTFLKEVLSIYTTHYPLAVAYILFIDMNFSFKFVYQIIKYFFPKYLREQMFLISSSELDQLIDENNLPDFLGGKMTVYDQMWFSDCIRSKEYVKLHELPESLLKKMADYAAKHSIKSYSINNN